MAKRKVGGPLPGANRRSGYTSGKRCGRERTCWLKGVIGTSGQFLGAGAGDFWRGGGGKVRDRRNSGMRVGGGRNRNEKERLGGKSIYERQVVKGKKRRKTWEPTINGAWRMGWDLIGPRREKGH